MTNGSAAATRAPIRPAAARMSELRIVAFCLYAAIIAWVFMIAFRYWSASQFMPYHSEALGMVWADVPSRIQILLVALINFVGGGFACVGLALALILCIPFRRGERWADWTIASTLFVFSASGYMVTHRVATLTGAHTPWPTLRMVFLANIVATGICVIDWIRTSRRARMDRR